MPQTTNNTLDSEFSSPAADSQSEAAQVGGTVLASDRSAVVGRLLARLSLPVVCAPMFLVSGPALVTEARKAGLVGALPSANARDEAQFADWMAEIFESQDMDCSTGGLLAANLNVRSSERMMTPRYLADLETCRRHRVPLVITVNGDPSPVIPEVHSWGGLLFHDVTTLHHARKAAAAGVDGLIAICGGGGGHSGALNPFAFVPQIRQFFDGVIVLAGGIATGGAVYAAQALGADLCYMGTRFIATEESLAPAEYKAMLVNSQSHELTYTPAFTRGTPAMMLNASLRKHGFDPSNLPHPSEAPSDIKPWRDLWAAGQGVGMIRDIPHVAQLAERLKAEYRQAQLDSEARLARFK